MTLTIDDVDMTPYIAYGGLKYTRSDIDSPNAGRSMDGLMHRGRVSTKIRLDVTCRPLKSSELGIVLRGVYPEYVTVTFYDPMTETVVTKQMYSNNNPASYLIKKPSGEEFWNGVTFPLVER